MPILKTRYAGSTFRVSLLMLPATIGALLAASCLQPSRAVADDANKPSTEPSEHAKIDVGVQLYSFRALMSKDVGSTLAGVQEMHISDVEVAALYGKVAQQFKAELDKDGLHASGAHFQWPQFSKDIDGIIRDAKALGCSYVTLPWIPHEGEFTVENAKETAAKFNEWGRKLADAGLKFTYHPHGYEFRPQAQGSAFDVLAKETDPALVNFELDIFWAYDAGMDPVKLMEKYPTRFPQMHLKDMSKDVKPPNYAGHENVEADVALGAGQIDLPAILKEAQKIGVKHYYIEDESSRSSKQVPQSVQYIRSIGY